MMEQIQADYKGQTLLTSANANCSVIASFPEDKALYRAKVLNVEFPKKFKVLYVDYGNVAVTQEVYAIGTKDMELPVQAVHCGLLGIKPYDSEWADAEIFSTYFGKKSFQCEFVSGNDEKLVHLFFNFCNMLRVNMFFNLMVSTEASWWNVLNLKICTKIYIFFSFYFAHLINLM